jgi:hypothetical protein
VCVAVFGKRYCSTSHEIVDVAHASSAKVFSVTVVKLLTVYMILIL